MHEITITESGTLNIVCLENPDDKSRSCARWAETCRIAEWFQETDPWEVRRRQLTALRSRIKPGTYLLIYKQDSFNGQVWDWYAADR